MTMESDESGGTIWPRVVAGVVFFVVTPGIAGVACGWSVIGFLIAPGIFLSGLTLVALMLTVEWVFGASPHDYVEAERDAR